MPGGVASQEPGGDCEVCHEHEEKGRVCEDTEPGQWGRGGECVFSGICYEGVCSDYCGPSGGACGGPEAVTMSGQVVISVQTEEIRAHLAEGTWRLDPAGALRRTCDDAIIVAPAGSFAVHVAGPQHAQRSSQRIEIR